MITESQKRINSATKFAENSPKKTNEVLTNQELCSELIRLCFLSTSKSAAKACRHLELVCCEKEDRLVEHLNFFCSNIKHQTDKSAIRALSKICMLLTISHFKKKEITPSENQLQQITETCFDWLMTDVKVATKCYAIRALHLLGNHFDWIHPELKIILENDYVHHSAAYKAVAKEILKKIK